MIIRLLPQQIPAYWENIKYVTSKSINVDFVTLLNELLNEKTQCWIVFDESKTLQGMALTKIEINKNTQKKSICIVGFVSFAMANNALYEEGMRFLMDFARKEQCDSIVSDVYNEDDRNIMSMLGFREKYRIYEMKL